MLYKQRDLVLQLDDLSYITKQMIINCSKQIIYGKNIILENGSIDYDLLVDHFNNSFLSRAEEKYKLNKLDLIKLPIDMISKYFEETLLNIFLEQYEIIKEKNDQLFQSFLRNIIITNIDIYWQDHINTMDKLKSSTNVVQYSQKNPYQIYTEEGSNKFNEMVDNIAFGSISNIFKEIFNYSRSSINDNQANKSNQLDLLERTIFSKIDEISDYEKGDLTLNNKPISIELNEQDLIKLDLGDLDQKIN